MDWMENVRAREKRKNQVLFRTDDLLLLELARQVNRQNRRVLILWSLELAEDSMQILEDKYPADHRLRQAVDAAHAWASGEIKMPIAKRAILACHAMAKDLDSDEDQALCHAVGQACSVVHTEGHALGYPIYELTALVRRHGIENCREAVEGRVEYYEERLRYWSEQEPKQTCTWAGFLRK